MEKQYSIECYNIKNSKKSSNSILLCIIYSDWRRFLREIRLELQFWLVGKVSYSVYSKSLENNFD